MNSNLEGWDGFVKALSSEWESNSVTEELLKLVPDEDLAKVIWGCLKSDAVRWLYRVVPMLDQQRPIDLLSSVDGSERVKWILLSSPWW